MSVGRVLRWWALDYVAAVRWQVGPLLRHHDPAAYLDGRPGLRPVVVLPGIWETWRFLLPLVERLHRAGHPVHAVTALRTNGATVDSSADIVASYLRDHDLEDVLVVAHSKGGLIGKAVMLGAEGRRVRAMLAISTPFSGSIYARYLPLPSLHAFSPNDPTTLRLAKELGVNGRITSVWAAFDPHIPGGSELPGAALNRRVDDGGHFRILRNPEVLAEVDRFAATA